MRKKSYHEFVIKGLNQERFFNKLASSFDVYDINRYEKNKTSFKVDIKNGKKVKKIILSSGFELLGEKRRGLIAKLLDFRHAYGIIAGVVVSVSLYLIQLPVIWKISINGVSYDIQEQICEFIKDNYKLHKYDLNCKQLEIELRNNFDNLSFVSIAVLGQSLVINAKEGDAPSEKTEVFSPIVCPIDCKIEDISLIQGTLNVHAGEIVRTGENLVLPYIIDASGNEKKVEPKAIIKVQSWLVGNESHKEEEYVWIRSGESYEENKLFLFGLEIYSHNKDKRFEHYEFYVKEKPFSKNNILPFIYQTTTYYEMIQEFKQINYESVRNDKINSAREKALQKISECDKIIDEKYVENVVGDLFTITYYITIEKELCFK